MQNLLKVALGTNTQSTPDLMKSLEYNLHLLTQATSPMEYYQSKLSCDLCQAALVTPDFILENKEIRIALDYLATEICVNMGIEGGERSVCAGAVKIMADELLPSIAEGILSPQRVCDEYLHLCPKPDIKDLDVDAYIFRVLSEKPDIIKSNDYIDKIYEKIASDKDRKKIKSIHIQKKMKVQI